MVSDLNTCQDLKDTNLCQNKYENSIMSFDEINRTIDQLEKKRIELCQERDEYNEALFLWPSEKKRLYNLLKDIDDLDKYVFRLIRAKFRLFEKIF